MNLEDLAQRASRELVGQTVLDPEARLTELKRRRTHRAVERAIAAAAAVALVAGGLWFANERRGGPQPTDSNNVGNGAFVYSVQSQVRVPTGGLDHVPEDLKRYSPLAFSSDGTELLYANRAAEVSAINVYDGTTRALADCLDEGCDFALSPDGSRIAQARPGDIDPGIDIRTIDTGEVRPLDTDGVGVASPRWSPDGQHLAFLSEQGIGAMSLTGDDLRLLYRNAAGDHAMALEWSPGRARRPHRVRLHPVGDERRRVRRPGAARARGVRVRGHQPSRTGVEP
jgi:dipeptidyl aminopeptidase/acylaminoacyl peptidase